LKKRIVLIAAALVLALTFCGCLSQGAATPLASPFEEGKVKSAAEAAIGLINSGSYQKLTDTMVSQDLHESLSPEVIKNAAQKTMPNAGEFVSYGSEEVRGTTDNSKNNYAVAIVTANYKNQKVIYTISFDPSMNIAGLYMKQG
jgi:hypothetical protein